MIYTFCRMIDDSVDEPESSEYTLDQLEALFEELDTAEGHFICLPCAGCSPASPLRRSRSASR